MSDSPKTAFESPRLHGLAFGNYDTARQLLNHVEQHLGHFPSHPPVMTGAETHEEMLSCTTTLLHNILRLVEEHLPVTRGEARHEEAVAVDHAVVASMNEQQLAEHVDPHVQLEHQEDAETAALNEQELGESAERSMPQSGSDARPGDDSETAALNEQELARHA